MCLQLFRDRLVLLRFRRTLAHAIIANVICIAALVNGSSPGERRADNRNWLLICLQLIARHHALRSIGHLITFGIVAALLGPWGQTGQRGSSKLVWQHVWLGGISLEAVQLAVRNTGMGKEDIRPIGADLTTNSIGALVSLVVIKWHIKSNSEHV
jgi:hypothetical protein